MTLQNAVTSETACQGTGAALSPGAAGGNRPMAGLAAWVITDGKPGMDVQARGVADALGLAYEMKTVAPTGWHRRFSPWGGVAKRQRFGEPGAQFAPPWPDVAIATGRLSIPYIRAVARFAGPGTYRVVLQDPKMPAKTADLIWVPQHDKRRGENVVTTLTAPHSFTPARIAAIRAALPDAIAALPSPRVAVVLGGKNAVYEFSDEADNRLGGALASLAKLGASFMITSSRRTHEHLLQATLDATKDNPRIVYDGAGDNPYPAFLCGADILVVTADSVNMCGEAAATGKPVYVFHPSAGSAKFGRFHDALRAYGATRDLPPVVEALPNWSYAPLDSAGDIAAEVERRWLQRQKA